MSTTTEKHLRHLKTFANLKAAIASLEARIENDKAKARKSRALRKERTPTVQGKPVEPPRKEVTASLRAQVLARSHEDCEFCGAAMRLHGFELHHILQGSGNRVSEERIETVAGVCIACHRAWHAADAGVLRNAKVWALRHGFKDALRAIEKRLGKIEEARRTA